MVRQTVLLGVEIGICLGIRKTQAEVETAIVTLRNIAV